MNTIIIIIIIRFFKQFQCKETSSSMCFPKEIAKLITYPISAD